MTSDPDKERADMMRYDTVPLSDPSAQPSAPNLPPPYMSVYANFREILPTEEPAPDRPPYGAPMVESESPSEPCECVNAVPVERKVGILLSTYRVAVGITLLLSVLLMCGGIIMMHRPSLVIGLLGGVISIGIGCCLKLAWSKSEEQRNSGLTILFIFLAVLAVLILLALVVTIILLWVAGSLEVMQTRTSHYDVYSGMITYQYDDMTGEERSRKELAVTLILLTIAECAMLVGLYKSLNILLELRKAIRNGLGDVTRVYKPECRCNLPAQVGGLPIQLAVLYVVRSYYLLGGAVELAGLGFLMNIFMTENGAEPLCVFGAILITIGALLILAVYKIDEGVQKKTTLGLTILIGILITVTLVAAVVTSCLSVMVIVEMIKSTASSFRRDMMMDYLILPRVFLIAAAGGLLTALIAFEVKVLLRYRKIVKKDNEASVTNGHVTNIPLLDTSRVFSSA